MLEYLMSFLGPADVALPVVHVVPASRVLSSHVPEVEAFSYTQLEAFFLAVPYGSYYQ